MVQTETVGGDRLTYTLYTYYNSPFAERVHIVLAELRIAFDEVIVDLTKPREEWFLKISPVRFLCLFAYAYASIRLRPIELAPANCT